MDKILRYVNVVFHAKLVTMRNIFLFISFFGVLFIQCKKSDPPVIESLPTEISAQINGDDVEIDDFILTNEIDGLRLYLRVDDKLISIYTNKRESGIYALYEKEGNFFRGSVSVYQNASSSITSGEVEILYSSDSIFSGSFNISTSHGLRTLI